MASRKPFILPVRYVPFGWLTISKYCRHALTVKPVERLQSVGDEVFAEDLSELLTYEERYRNVDKFPIRAKIQVVPDV
jgi:hypothetical protein